MNSELEVATDTGNSELQAKLIEEIAIIQDYFSASTGKGGQPRKLSNNLERTRSTVTRRIKGGIEKITASLPALGKHLGAFLKTGQFCSYRPDPPVIWKF
jgi:hypothetical protein